MFLEKYPALLQDPIIISDKHAFLGFDKQMIENLRDGEKDKKERDMEPVR